jgi:hypothetical protein
VKGRATGPIRIHSRVLRPAALAKAQNNTAQFVWQSWRRSRSYLIADEVGAGKSYVSLSLAFGLWRSQRPRKRCFRILVLAGPSELNHSWLQKLAGNSPEESRIATLAQVPGTGSFTDLYLEPSVRTKQSDIVIYHLRFRRDISRLAEALDDNPTKSRRLAPRRRHSNGSVEVLVTSPSWVKRLYSQRGGPARSWAQWLQKADVIIADEIFAGKNEKTIYGRILRPSTVDDRPRLWKRRRPALLGLSATLLSRDLSDARAVLQLCLAWRARTKSNELLSHRIENALDGFSRELRAGLRTRSEAEMGKHRKKYGVHKKTLESLLPELIVRTISHRPRSYRFAPGGHNDREVFALHQPAPDQTSFPVSRVDILLTNLQSQLSKAGDASECLAWFLRRAATSRAGSEDGERQYATWTAITESYPSKDPSERTTNHPKILSLLQWVETYYAKSESSWLKRGIGNEPRFKLLIYVHHVKTASELKPPRSGNKDSAGGHLLRLLRRLMLSSCKKIAQLNRDLFGSGDLSDPLPNLKETLSRQGWTIEQLMKSNRTLLLAACVNAHKGRNRREKLNRFRETLVGSNVDWRLHQYRQVLRRLPEFRRRVLEEIGCEDTLSLEEQLRKRHGKLTPTPSIALLDIDSLDLSPQAKEAARKSLGRLAPLMKPLVSVFGIHQQETSPLLVSMAKKVARLIERHQEWKDTIESFASAPERVFNRLRRQTEGLSHRNPLEVAVQTGEESGARDFVADKFRSPGNPFTLILTNVCTVGVDLHTYCWDVLHYTPAWTPHEAEQKTGRIDRPRLQQSAEKLRISRASALKRIRIHYLIWPYTYDERILSRLNLRAQLSERLLGSKHQDALERNHEETVVESLPRFKPLQLEPKLEE